VLNPNTAPRAISQRESAAIDQGDIRLEHAITGGNARPFPQLVRRGITFGFSRLRYWRRQLLQNSGINSVYSVVDLFAGFSRKVMKSISKSAGFSFKTTPIPPELAYEQSILNRFATHAAVVPWLDLFQGPGNWNIIMPFIPGKDGVTWIETTQQRPIFPADGLRRIALQLFQLLAVMHQNRVVHGDLKLENLMIDIPYKNRMDLPKLYVIDFFCAKQMLQGYVRGTEGGKEIVPCGTPQYLPPEAVNLPSVDVMDHMVTAHDAFIGNPLANGFVPEMPTSPARGGQQPQQPGTSPQQGPPTTYLPPNHQLYPQVQRLFNLYEADVFAAGFLLYTLGSGMFPYTAPPNTQYADVSWMGCNRQTINNLQFPENIYGKDGAEFLKYAMAPPGQRPSATELMNHPWLRIDLPGEFMQAGKFPTSSSMPSSPSGGGGGWNIGGKIKSLFGKFWPGSKSQAQPQT